MTKHRKTIIHTLVALVITATLLVSIPQTARADDPEFDAITKHLKLRFNARRVSIPFLGLARFFVKIVRPAGVKSFKVAIFEDLNLRGVGTRIGLVMRGALSPNGQPLVTTRSRGGEQVMSTQRSGRQHQAHGRDDRRTEASWLV